MSKGCSGGCIGTNAAKVVVIGGWLCMFVHGWSDSLGFIEVFSHLRIPDNTEAVNVVEFVPHRDFILRRIAIGSMRDQFWKVVVIDLLGNSMGLA
jgi:hypothetical protein